MVEIWKEAGIIIKYVQKVEALGIGLGAGYDEMSMLRGTGSRP